MGVSGYPFHPEERRQGGAVLPVLTLVAEAVQPQRLMSHSSPVLSSTTGVQHSTWPSWEWEGGGQGQGTIRIGDGSRRHSASISSQCTQPPTLYSYRVVHVKIVGHDTLRL